MKQTTLLGILTFLFASVLVGQNKVNSIEILSQKPSKRLIHFLGLSYHSGSFASDPSKNKSIYQSKSSPGFPYLGAVYGYNYRKSRSWQVLLHVNAQKDLDKLPKGGNMIIDTTIQTSSGWFFFIPYGNSSRPRESNYESVRYYANGGFQFQINHRKEFNKNKVKTFLQFGINFEKLYLIKSQYTFFGDIKGELTSSHGRFPFLFGSTSTYQIKGTSWYSEKKVSKELTSFVIASGLNFKLYRHFYFDIGVNLKVNMSTSHFSAIPYKFTNINMFASIGKYF